MLTLNGEFTRNLGEKGPRPRTSHHHPKGFVDGERGTSKGVEKDSLERQFLVLLYGC